MASSRRNSNGRSPLVNPQRQITSFFSKSTSPTPSPSPILSNTKQKRNSKSIPDPNPSPNPTTPSPSKSKPHKPLLVIGASSSSPSTPSSLFGEEVVGRRIKVYWPLDKAWYEGLVKSFDNLTSKHLVQYDDDEEESLDLSKEKIEWIQDSSSKKLKRLRRGCLGIKPMVIDDNEVEESPKDEDDSSDEDWGKNAPLEDSGEGEEEDMELEDEEDVAEKAKGKHSGKVEPRKRKLGEAEKPEPTKRSKEAAEVGKGGFKLSVLEPTSNWESK